MGENGREGDATVEREIGFREVRSQVKLVKCWKQSLERRFMGLPNRYFGGGGIGVFGTGESERTKSVDEMLGYRNGYGKWHKLSLQSRMITSHGCGEEVSNIKRPLVTTSSL